ncbi:hypothetical protein NADFUDRAFT_52204 [Nadsonia fulvescens var. elongata DSM 6958]|uniref:DNA-directed RNA polymerase subunit n=1 Tax=Nadsonia fulvescens var. elongata DSM 6958 TaxID=857566 RepID=A0A1E3PGM9_9ASCO|nr:hypothetical protein NADFUDRAFT_52204 [Nadsonia fulvescens var. elongata DSM 6958]
MSALEEVTPNTQAVAQPGASAPLKRRRQDINKNPVNENGISQCFHKVSTSLYVSLAPVYSQSPLIGIQTMHLDPLIMTYYAPVDGVVLAHSNTKLFPYGGVDSEGVEMPEAKFKNDSPFTYMWISTEFLVWKPQVNDFIEGHINMSSPSHIGLLVHDTFNASIKHWGIPKDWQFIASQADEATEEADEEQETSAASDTNSLGHWVDAEGKRVEGLLQFTVKTVHNSGKVISLDGSLIAPGVLREDLTTPSKDISVPKIHKKFGDDEEEAEIEEQNKIDEVEVQTAPEYVQDSDSGENEESVGEESSVEEESD